jgi:RHS repeat-associated protein
MKRALALLLTVSLPPPLLPQMAAAIFDNLVAIGGSGNDEMKAVTSDGSFYYFLAETTSRDYPGAVAASFGGATDLVLTKYDPRLGQTVWSRFIGGPQDERAGGVAVDAAGNITVVGSTAWTGLPVTPDAIQAAYGGGASDAFLTTYNKDGRLIYASYLGGTGAETGVRFRQSPQGWLFVAGTTTGGFPVRTGGWQTTAGGASDVFVVKITEGTRVEFATYVGGGGNDTLSDIFIDAAGNPYLFGSTASTNFPVTANALQRTSGGGTDGFVVKLGINGGDAVYSTYLGGSGEDTASQMTVASGEAWVGMQTRSTNMPVSGSAFIKRYSANTDAYVARLNATGTALTAATYLGGEGDENLGPILVKPNGGIEVVFISTSSDWGGRAVAESTGPGPKTIEAPYVNVLSMLGNLSNVLGHVTQGPCLAPNSGTIFAMVPDNPLASSINSLLNSVMSLFGYAQNMVPCTSAKTVGIMQGRTAVVSLPQPALPPPAPSGKRSLMQVRPYAASSGDPVATAFGELYDAFTDLSIPGPLPLEFERYYSSALAETGESGALGLNWTHTYEDNADVRGNEANLFLFPGRQIQFRRASATAAWEMTTNLPERFQLVTSATETRLLEYATNLVKTFNAAGQLIRIADRNGNALAITQSANGPTRVDDGRGRVLTFLYANDGSLVRVGDTAGRFLLFEHRGATLSGVTGLNGRKVSYSYTRGGRMTARTLPLGENAATFTYDGASRVTRQTDARGNAMTFAYGDGETTVTDALGHVTKHRHGAQGQLAAATDEAGNTASATYDASNNLTSVADKTGGVSRQTIHAPTGYIASVTDPSGAVQANAYAPQAQDGLTYYVLTASRFADGSSETFTYDARGNVTSRKDRAGTETRFSYSAQGWPTLTTYADGSTGITEYNTNGTVASLTLPSGQKTTFSYDTRLRVIEATMPGGVTRKIGYDASDRSVSESDALGATSTTVFDGNDRITALVDKMGNRFELGRDADGNLTRLVDRTGGATTMTYDPLSRMTGFALPSGRRTTYGIDAKGRITTTRDEAGLIETVAYDAEDRAIRASDGLDRAFLFEYNRRGLPSKMTTPGGETISWTYDAFGNIVTTVDPLGREVIDTRDANGRIAKTALAGTEVSFEWDALDQRKSATDANGGKWTWSYDAGGRVSKSVDPLGRETAYSYSERGALSKLTLPEGTLDLTTDAEGGLRQKSYSDGTVIAFDLDALGRAMKATGVELAYDGEGRITKSNSLGITRDADGRIATVTYAADKVVAYAYDRRGRVESVTDWLGGVTKLTYNAANEVTGIERANGVNASMTYDANGRLASASEGSVSTLTLTRDKNGNIVEAERSMPANPVLASGVQESTYDAAHQRSGVDYDKMGRPISETGRSYTWDLESRLTSVTSSEGTQRFAYDAFGHLTGWSDGAKTRGFVQNYALELVSPAIEQRDGADFRYQIHLPGGMLLYTIDAASGERRHYHYDEMGNTAFLTNDAGAVTESYAPTPYGESAASSASENLFVYQGSFGVISLGQGLYQMRARVFDANAARFLTPDPVQRFDLTASSPYSYAMQNPLRYVDPTGDWPWDGLVSAVVNGTKAAVGAVVDTGKRAVEATVSAAKAVGSAVANAATSVYQGAKQAAVVVADGTKRAVQTIARAAGDAVVRVVNASKAAAQWAVNRLREATQSISGVLANIRIVPPKTVPYSFTKLQRKRATEILRQGGDVLTKLRAAGLGAMTASQLRALGGGDLGIGAGGRMVAAGAGNLRISHMVAAGGGNLTINQMISAAAVNTTAGGYFKALDRELTKAGGAVGIIKSSLIGNDGSTLIGNDGSTLIGLDGSTLIGNDGSTLVGNDGGS